MRTKKSGTGDPKDPKKAFIDRARAVSGKDLKGFSEMNLGLDYNKLQGMSNEEMNALLSLVQRMAPDEKGDVGGGISKAMGSLGEIKSVVGGLRDNYGVNPKSIVEGVIEHKNPGFIKSNLIRAGAKAAGLYMGGGKMSLVKRAQEGMRVKKKDGDPKKESTGYARLDARLARMAAEAPSDTTNYMRDSAERIQRQMQAESGGERDPDRAVSEAGAMGRWQIMPDTQRDLEDRGLIPRGLDPYDSKASRQMRDAKINALMKLQFIDNPPQPIPEVNKLARIYASYNYGEGNVLKALNKAKEEGVDIYGDPRAWMGYLPEETRGYLNKILFD